MTSSCTVTPLIAGSCDGQSFSPTKTTCLKSKMNEQKQHLASHTTTTTTTTTTITNSNNSSLDMNDQEENQIQFILSQLTDQELEVAARASYEYLKHPLGKHPAKYARQMAQRYFTSKKGNAQLALKKLKETLAFRQQVDMDGLRLAFDDGDRRDMDNRVAMAMDDDPSESTVSSVSSSSSSASSLLSSSPSSSEEYHRMPLEKYLASGKSYVMSHDKEGRSTHIFVPRNTLPYHKEWTLKESLYTMERAIACSKAPDQSVNAICDFRGFSALQHAPPLSAGQQFLTTLRQHYAGQVHRIFILEAPKSFVWLWHHVLKPFVGTATQDKIVFLNGNQQIQTVLSEYYDESQAASWMLPLAKHTGKNRELNVQEYLYQTPFDQAFDE